ncbi:hypothetical protein GCM10009850_120930 [Nonomuraea monospora]|uniref:SnoaL-like domain-containing protein n=1 Tax=Nonomuraea monospora TaxID=568818 RepID=A0ABP5Q096_9ACTN
MKLRHAAAGMLAAAAIGLASLTAVTASADAKAGPTPHSGDLARVGDRQEIENVMGRYVAPSLGDDFAASVLALFDLDSPKVQLSIASGPTLVGKAAVTGYWNNLQRVMKANGGVLGQHMLTSPVITVSQDGKSARGIWQDNGVTLFGPGMGVPPQDKEHTYTAHREISRYDVTFHHTSKGWKIRSLAWTILWEYEPEKINESAGWISDTSAPLPEAP